MTLPPPTTLLLRATLQDILSELLALQERGYDPTARSYAQRELARHLRLLAHLVEVVRLDFGQGQYSNITFPDPHEVLRSLS